MSRQRSFTSIQTFHTLWHTHLLRLVLSNFDVECICRAKKLQFTPDRKVWCGVKRKFFVATLKNRIKSIETRRIPQYKQKNGMDKRFTAVSDSANCAER